MKHVDVVDSCPFCLTHSESIFHVLVQCEFASACWQKAGVTQINDHYIEFIEWAKAQFASGPEDKKKKIVMVCYEIWRARNERVWNRKEVSSHQIVMLVSRQFTQC